MYLKRFLFLISATLCLVGCNYQLYAPIVEVKPAIAKYRYAYIIPTGSVTSGLSSEGDGYTKSISPSEVIAGDLMQRGYSILPQINQDLIDKTMIVNYGEVGVRDIGYQIYTKEVIIQFRDAQSQDLICSGKAEGLVDFLWGSSTEVDAVVFAIKKALDSIYEQSKPYLEQ